MQHRELQLKSERKIGMYLRVFLIGILFSVTQATVASAGGVPVFDGAQAANMVQLFFRYKEELEMIATQLKNDELNLTALDISWKEELTEQIRRIAEIQSEATSLIESYDSLYNQVEEVYPDWSYSSASEEEFRKQIGEWHQVSKDSEKRVLLTSQQIIDDLLVKSGRMDETLSTSRTATGSLSAVQATNELLGQVNSTLLDTQTVFAAYAQASTLKDAEQRSREERERKAGEEAMRDWGKRSSKNHIPMNKL